MLQKFAFLEYLPPYTVFTKMQQNVAFSDCRKLKEACEGP